MPNHPLKGERLEYVVPAIGKNYHMLMKESIGTWLGLTPVFPQYGKFKSTDNNSVKDSKGNILGNAGVIFTRRAGFRFVSYRFLLLPKTEIYEPDANGKPYKREMNSISIGFPRGTKNAHTSVHSVIEFAKSCKQHKKIRGIVTPAGTKHLWRGKMSATPDPGSGNNNSGNNNDGGGGLLGDLATLGSDAAKNGSDLINTVGDLVNLASDIGGLLF